jgi:hypothetical protein
MGWKSEPLLKKMLLGFIFAAQAYWTIAMLEAAIYAGFVLTKIYDPSECPPTFGSLKDLYTVRNAWS